MVLSKGGVYTKLTPREVVIKLHGAIEGLNGLLKNHDAQNPSQKLESQRKIIGRVGDFLLLVKKLETSLMKMVVDNVRVYGAESILKTTRYNVARLRKTDPRKVNQYIGQMKRYADSFGDYAIENLHEIRRGQREDIEGSKALIRGSKGHEPYIKKAVNEIRGLLSNMQAAEERFQSALRKQSSERRIMSPKKIKGIREGAANQNNRFRRVA